jgi:hypothetical protein
VKPSRESSDDRFVIVHPDEKIEARDALIGSSEKEERESDFNACCFKSLCLENVRELKEVREKLAARRPYSDKLAQEVIAEQVKEIDRLHRELASLRPASAGEKNYRRLLEESNLPIEKAVEIADELDAAVERERLANMRADQAEEALAARTDELGRYMMALNTPVSATGAIVDGVDVPHAWPEEAINGPRSEPEALVAWLATVKQIGPERAVEVMKKRLARLEELRPSASPDNRRADKGQG